MTWRGTITRNGGELRHDGEPTEPIVLTVGEIIPGQKVELRGIQGNQHWRGEIAADRETFKLVCQFGFTISGRLTRAGFAYEVADVRMVAPPVCLLPGEVA